MRSRDDGDKPRGRKGGEIEWEKGAWSVIFVGITHPSQEECCKKILNWNTVRFYSIPKNELLSGLCPNC